MSWKILSVADDGRKAYKKIGNDEKIAYVYELSDSAYWSIFQYDGNNKIAGGETINVESAKKEAEMVLNE